MRNLTGKPGTAWRRGDGVGTGDGVGPRGSRLGRRFWRFWSASFASNLSDGVAFIALPWIATTLTDDAFWVGVVAASGRLPWLLAAIPAGVLIDRLSRVGVMAVAAVARAILWGVLGVLALTDQLRLDLLIAAAAALGLAEVFYDTAALTLLPALVPDDRLESANGQFRTAEITAQEFAGRPVGGLALTAGMAPALFLNATVCALVVALLARLRGSDGTRRHAGEGQGSLWRRTGAGVAAIWTSPLLRRLVGTTMAFNAAYSTVLATQVLFVQTTLGLGSAEFGLLMLAAAAGGVVGGQCSGLLAARLPAGWLPMASLATASGCFLTMAATPTVPVVVAMLFLSSAGVLSYSVSVAALRQRATPSHLLGRVNAASGTASWGIATVGMAGGGALVGLAERWLPESDAPRLPYALTAAVGLTLVLTVGRSLTRLSARLSTGRPRA